MVRAGEIEHGELIAHNAEAIWNWSSPAGRLRAKRRAKLIAEAAGLGPETYALELGCGTGLFTRSFAETGSRLLAIDVSPTLLAKARGTSKRDRVAFGREDAEHLTCSDESFDAVIGSSVLHHLELDRALGEVYRVLRPGGRIAFAEPNMMNPQIALQRSVPLFRRWAGESPEETAFFRWRLGAKLRRAGFTNICIEPFDFLHPAVPRSLIPIVSGVGVVMECMPLIREIAGSLIISASRVLDRHTSTPARFVD